MLHWYLVPQFPIRRSLKLFSIYLHMPLDSWCWISQVESDQHLCMHHCTSSFYNYDLIIIREPYIMYVISPSVIWRKLQVIHSYNHQQPENILQLFARRITYEKMYKSRTINTKFIIDKDGVAVSGGRIAARSYSSPGCCGTFNSQV